MKLNTAWLLQYLDKRISHRDLVDAMPRGALEVEVESELKVDLAPVRIGFIRNLKTLDGGMHHAAIEIEPGQVIDVLVGNDHEVKVGWGVPVAPAGVTLPTGKKVAAGKFHGVESVGMICSDGEMGLIARGSGLHHFTDESLLGKRFVDVVDVPEYLIELKVLPNRPDCLGILGIAREMAALFDCNVVWPKTPHLPSGSDEPVEVEVLEPELCSRITLSPFKNVKVGPSPAWLKNVLLTAGMRPINNVVDITNFVMWESGQPLHAFDLAKIAGRKIVVRKLKGDESLELLSGKVITSKYGQPLCICDAEKPQGLAGIMGGKSAETAAETSEVLLEIAHFDPVHIRSNVKSLRRVDGSGGTDASYRFERGTDPVAMLDFARLRATSLMADLAGATPAAPPVDYVAKQPARRQYVLTPDQVSGLIGMPVDTATIRSSLQKLSYVVDEALNVTVPTHRVDVDNPVVLIEDVARLIGYDNIPMGGAIGSTTRGAVAPAYKLRQRVAQQLVAGGWYETKNDPLESAAATSKWLGEPPDQLTLANAASAQMAVLRRSLLTGLAASAQRNIFRGATTIRLFEIDRTFNVDSGKTPGVWTLSGIAGGAIRRANWQGDAAISFYHVKGELEDLLEGLGVRNIEFTPAEQQPLAAGTGAHIKVGGTLIGYVGELDAKQIKIDRQAFKLFVFDINLAALEKFAFPTPAYQPMNKLPPVTRDLAIVVKSSEPYAAVASIIHETGGAALEKLELVDEYTGKPVPAGHRSLAMRLTFRDAHRTLATPEVTERVQAIVEALEKRLSATLRA